MAGRYVLDVTPGGFHRDVLEKSRAVPVVVDFWAPWCSPCALLGPVLEKVVGEYNGKVILAKVNADSYPELAEQYLVRSIPSVKLFVGGEVVAEFRGAIPEPQVREFVRRAVPSDSEELLRQAREFREKGNLKEAESLARKALEDSPEDQSALEIVAMAAMVEGRVDEALDVVNRMEAPSKDMEFLAEGAEFWRLCAKAATEKETFHSPPEGPDEEIAHAACLASKGEFIQAFDLLLKMVETNKSFRDGLARKAMVSMFVVMGLGNPTVKEYQSRLARLLF